MSLVLETPVKLRLPAAWVGSTVEADLCKELSFEDGSAAHEFRTWQKVKYLVDRGRPHWFVTKYGKDALDAKVAELAAAKDKSALFKDARGYYTYSGLATRLSKRYGEPVVRAYDLPEPELIPYAKAPFESRWYQQEAEELLAAAGHGGVSLPTGSGKSLVIIKLLKSFGLPAVVMTPSLSIANQLTADAEAAFGKKYVGRFFGGKKEANKRFVVAVSKSLTAVEKGSPIWQALAEKKVLLNDESHLTPAMTLAKVVMGLFASTPYRFFFSGTQFRNDGRDLVLEGITSEIVKEISLKQLVGEGFLAHPTFFQYHAKSSRNFDGDPIKMNRIHLHQNDAIYKNAGNLLSAALHAGRRPLVLIDEVSQFPQLLPHLKSRCGLAHGGTDKDQRKTLPELYHKSDPQKLVAAFDAGELPILVGTGCIGTGTDIKTADFIIDIVGLASETRLSQSIGRGTRIHGGKKRFAYIDYVIDGITVLENQGKKRRKVMESMMNEDVRHQHV